MRRQRARAKGEAEATSVDESLTWSTHFADNFRAQVHVRH